MTYEDIGERLVLVEGSDMMMVGVGCTHDKTESITEKYPMDGIDPSPDWIESTPVGTPGSDMGVAGQSASTLGRNELKLSTCDVTISIFNLGHEEVTFITPI